ncbi:hypothetical protein NBO_8g0019 [Nosema bombycis CQ1]|uniref:Uncharacterized protein n=1 Tax=Nosema bombycis (strain CQ1 / CVCC 102059) TaxID=578461 RepID=R0MB06_NOSB1|nr:hypothetical protein NBO_8g0019 [Nosema bombycis CQ1]|eukprot:EOB15154.1 hypothetical protein NBO_8g0019 [Nosema bombycis CQ1]
MKLVNVQSSSGSVDRDESNRNSHGESKKDKWCKHHKFYGHHTKDCIFEKKANEERMTAAYDYKETEIKESRESDDSSDLNEMIIEKLCVIREVKENHASLKTSSDEKDELDVKNKSRLKCCRSLRDYVTLFKDKVDERIC